MLTQSIHQGQPVLTYGAPLADAHAAVILIHGRGATAHSMHDLASALPTEGIAYLIPQAAGNTWYPHSGFKPFEVNEPYFSSAMAIISELLAHINAAGIPTDKIVIGGFSQGASLTSEFTVRHAQRYGAILLFSSALMGPPESPREYAGSFAGTPVFIGGVTQDPWVRESQLRETAEVFTRLGGQVTLDIAAGAEHGIRPTEIEQAAALIRRV
ncbi:MAG: alpha/beta fold hydrolase [Anaerolineae bacterium]|nr:alpha/beta fold hydrolase [Anaerolineae bacterium]